MSGSPNFSRKIHLSALLEQIKPSFGTSKPHLQRLQEAPLIVQVPLPKYRIAQDIFNTLHIGTGTRIDVNIWKFQNSEDLESFIDSLFMLGFEEKDVIYPSGFLGKIKDEEGNIKSTNSETNEDQDLQDLESGLGGETDVDFDAGFNEAETPADEEYTLDLESDESLENDLEDLENDTELSDLEFELADTGEFEDEILSELDDELTELEQQLEENE